MSVLAREWVAQSPGNYAEISSPSETDISTKKLSIVRHGVVTDPRRFRFRIKPERSSACRVNSILPNDTLISRSWRYPN
jgi:hypothetical protein